MLRLSIPAQHQMTCVVFVFLACGILSKGLAVENKPLDVQQEKYAEAESLNEALDVLKVYLDEHGLSAYAPLLTDESVKAGIRNTLEALKRRARGARHRAEQLQNGADELPNEQKVYVDEVVAPLCRQVLDGKWPDNAYFYCTRPNPKYSAFIVNLVVDLRLHDLDGYKFAAGTKPTAFGVNVLTLNYGLEPRLQGHTTGKALLGQTEVRRIVSPDGTLVAYGQFVVGPKGEVSSRIIVCAVDGTRRRVIPVKLERVHEVLWFSQDTLAYSDRDDREYHLVDLEGGKRGMIRLPGRCDVLYKSLSPNGRYIAFAGRVTAEDVATDETKHGVFVYDSQGGELRQLWSEAIKTAPAWSSDSTSLAVGNAGGYVQHYPLSIARVEDGSTEDLPSNGVGISWAPTNDALAFTTKVTKGGSWLQGVPMDGRIGVWDLRQKSLALVSQQAVNQHGEEKPWEISGCYEPVWSPDGKWIAYQRRHRNGDSVQDNVWLVRRDGSERQKILNHAAQVAFTPDGQTIVWVHDGRLGNVKLTGTRPELGETPWRPYHRFSLYGTVRGRDGRPIANAIIRVATGYGTLRSWKPVHTNDHGEYRVFFGTGFYMQNDPVQLQVVNVTVEKDGYYEDTLGERGRLAMAYQRPQEENDKGWYHDIVFERHPYRLDFVVSRAAQLQARLVNTQGEPLVGYSITLASTQQKEALVLLETGSDGGFTYNRVPLRKYHFRLGSAKGPRVESQSFDFDEPRKYDLTITYDDLAGTLSW